MNATSTALGPAGGGTAATPPRDHTPRVAGVMLAVALLALFVPVFRIMADTVWASEEQGHGPIILAVSAWLVWMRRAEIGTAVRVGARGGLGAWGLLIAGLALYFVGRVLHLVMFQMLSLIPIVAGGAAAAFGWSVVRACAFPLFFLIFAVPLPGPLVDALTSPLKQAVSWVAEQVLWRLGYPISRSGVILTIGPYQMLVADACSGLNSMFTLEALGLLYVNIVGHVNRLRNVLLAILIIPMSFIANVMRVMILVLVTYHFGDAAGQGVVHGMAGMVLFMVALVLMLIIDWFLGLFFKERKPQGAAA